MSSDARQHWFADMISAGLEHAVLAPADVLEHVTPDVLAEHLPPSLMSKILAASLETGAFTADSLLQTINPEVLAAHVPHDILWSCVASAAQRAGIATGK